MNRLHIEMWAAFGLLMADLLPACFEPNVAGQRQDTKRRTTTPDQMRLAGIPFQV